MVATLPTLVVMLALGQSGLSPKEAASAKELQKIQGGWIIDSWQEGDKACTPEELNTRRFHIGGSIFLLYEGSTIKQGGDLVIDPTRAPHRIRATIREGPHKGADMIGIYDYDGDTLKVCLDMEGQDRPNDFKAGANILLVVLKRSAEKKNEEDITGVYKEETATKEGKASDMTVHIQRVGEAYQVTYKKGGNTVFVGMGLRDGKSFSVSWLSNGQIGASIYHIESKDRMVGSYAIFGGPGNLVEETLTRIESED